MALAFAVGLLAYCNTLANGFVWDDLIWLDQKIRFYQTPLDVFMEPSELPGFRVYRPLTFGSYWIDQILWWRNPFGFHLTSVLLHALNCVLLLKLATNLGCRAKAALIAALFFALHPIHTESVAWIAGRGDVLVTFFALIAILAARAYALRERKAQLLLIGAATFAAIASKEAGAAVPFLVLACVSAPETMLGPGRLEMRRWLPVAGACTAGLLPYLLLRPPGRSPGLDLAAFTFQGLLTLAGALGFYLSRVIWPLNLNAYMPQAPSGPVLYALAAVYAVAFLAALSQARTRWLTCFSLFWFMVALAPSLLVVLADISVTAVAERYLYLPSVGVALLLAGELSRRPAFLDHRAVMSVALLVLAAFAAMTAARNQVWHDEITLWSDVAKQEKRYSLPYMNLGLALAGAGRVAEAETAYRQAVVSRGTKYTHRNTYVNLGHLKLRQGSLDEAEGYFLAANKISPHASAYYGLGAVARARARKALKEGKKEEAARGFAQAAHALTAALAINPRHFQSHYLLASVSYQTGRYEAAVFHFRRVVEIAGDTSTGRQAMQALRELTGSRDRALPSGQPGPPVK